MRGLGRLIALPFLLIALALQGLASAQAEAMPRDAFGFPICSSQGHPQTPQHGQPHDCCAAACALAGLAGGPPNLPHVARAAFGAAIAFNVQRRFDGPAHRAVRQPRARGPPAIRLATI
jgi:hypothetical protein